jgi:hypothetical protein
VANHELDPVVRAFLQMRTAKRSAQTVRRPVNMDVVVARARDAIRAAKFEEPPLHVQRRLRDAMLEGAAVMRAHELWAWARATLIERERAAGRSEEEAQRAAAIAMLVNDGS